MTRRVLIYAAIYGSIGVAVGVLLALYTAPNEEHKNIVLKSKSNGSTVEHDSAPVVEPNKVEETS